MIRAIVARLLRRESRAYHFLQSAFSLDIPARLIEPENTAIVVLAPHMDDEVIGCGGTLGQHARAGAQICVVFVTDARYVNANAHLPAAERERLRTELLAVRKREAHAACEVLGITDLQFIDADPAGLEESTTAAAKLREILLRIRPSIVYVPVFLDRHPDHRATSGVLLRAVAGTDFSCECRAYEVWTPLIPNVLVRIDDTMEMKMRALKCHASQLAHTDFVHMSSGLNAYRAAGVPDGAARYAEAFLSAPLPEYLRLYRSFREPPQAG
jgi:LmbE family N-acetylglucosaminyl deacetylase